ncbi:MAG: YkgJ family cysteine cluster protein [Pseudomonadota bacterium]
MSSTDVIEAGPFGEWLAAMRAVLRGEQSADVPCGDCVGCCISSYPIPLRPTDGVALETVPSQYLHLPADSAGGLARMGFREDGSCPMLCAGKCSIYSDRPQTCRDYDCRIYAAAGLLPDGARPVIQERVLAWRFAFGSADEQAAAEAVQRAARFISSNSALFPAGMRAGSATAVAVLAVKTQALFADVTGTPGMDDSIQQRVRRLVDAAHAFDQGAT